MLFVGFSKFLYSCCIYTLYLLNVNLNFLKISKTKIIIILIQIQNAYYKNNQNNMIRNAYFKNNQNNMIASNLE